MPKINKVSWGKVRIDDQKYWQVLVIASEIIPRKVEAIKEKYGTDHLVSSEEQKLLLSKNPEVILIASGWSGVLKVQEEFREKIKAKGVELKTLLTPRAVKEYNQLVTEGKRVNALIHTTC